MFRKVGAWCRSHGAYQGSRRKTVTKRMTEVAAVVESGIGNSRGVFTPNA
jgi:hypothetical protein